MGFASTSFRHQHRRSLTLALPDGTEFSYREPNEIPSEWLSLVEQQHRANFALWHIEDEARIPGASASDLADVKRRVDWTNQRRNDLAEDLDRFLLGWLEERGLPNPDAPLHSESPGLIVDRLSILAR